MSTLASFRILVVGHFHSALLWRCIFCTVYTAQLSGGGYSIWRKIFTSSLRRSKLRLPKQLNHQRSTEFGNSAQRMYPIMSLLRWILNDFLTVSSYHHVPLSMSKESQFWCQLPCSIAEWYLWFKKKLPTGPLMTNFILLKSFKRSSRRF